MMGTVIGILAIFVVGFLAGLHIGTGHGYDHAMKHVNDTIDKLEKLYRRELGGPRR
jgi:hypothetical protein